MKALRTPLITAGLLVALAGSAMAQMGPGGMPGPGAQPGPRMERMHERMVQRHATRMNELKAKLQIEAGQEGAWKSFADAMQPPVQPAPRPERATLEKLSTPERLDRLQAFAAEHQGHMQKRIDATRAFYASLNPEQKKTFDAETGRFMAAMGPHGMQGMHGMRHHH